MPIRTTCLSLRPLATAIAFVLGATIMAALVSCSESGIGRVVEPPPNAKDKPDDPGPPLPQIVQFPNGSVTLEGTLELPGHDGPYPVIAYVHGSGLRTRSDYQTSADLYRSQGYAIFRYDKRGVGASGGVYSGVNTGNAQGQIALLASDAAAAIDTLVKLPAIDSERVILMGASQAGWIIPVAATLSPYVWCNVIIVGPTVTVGEEIYYSNLTADPTLSDSAIAALLDAYTGDDGFDPLPYLYIMKQPTLWMYGGEDQSIPSYKSIEILEAVIGQHNKPFTIHLYPEGTHNMINAFTGQPINFRRVITKWLHLTSQGIQLALDKLD